MTEETQTPPVAAAPSPVDPKAGPSVLTGALAPSAAIVSAADGVLNSKPPGFIHALRRGDLWTSVDSRIREIRRNSTHLVVIGIGGSSIGARALVQALGKLPPSTQLDFLDTVDSDHFWKWYRGLKDPGAIHWVIISKSGKTLESLVTADFVDSQLRSAGHRRLSQVCTVVSETGPNPLSNWARREGVPLLEIPADVGGRFSAFTASGLLAAAFTGVDLQELRAGAEASIHQPEFAVQLGAAIVSCVSEEHPASYLWSYTESLSDFGRWWQQLWAESLGKRSLRSGAIAPRASVPVPLCGVRDQHSVLQQIVEGARPCAVFVQRIEAQQDVGPRLEKTLFETQDYCVGRTLAEIQNAEIAGTGQSLSEAGVKVITVSLPQVSPRVLGHLMMSWQIAIAIAGEATGLNPFDQPGVERGKILGREILLRDRNQ